MNLSTIRGTSEGSETSADEYSIDESKSAGYIFVGTMFHLFFLNRRSKNDHRKIHTPERSESSSTALRGLGFIVALLVCWQIVFLLACTGRPIQLPQSNKTNNTEKHSIAKKSAKELILVRLCQKWYAIESYGRELSTVQRWSSNSQYRQSYRGLIFWRRAQNTQNRQKLDFSFLVSEFSPPYFSSALGKNSGTKRTTIMWQKKSAKLGTAHSPTQINFPALCIGSLIVFFLS